MFLSWWRSLVFAVICVLGTLAAVPSLLPKDMREQWPSWIPGKPVTLGLDLQGGVYLLLEVGTKEVLEERYGTMLSHVRKVMRENKIRYTGLRKSPRGISLVLNEEKDGERAVEILQKEDGRVSIDRKARNLLCYFNEAEIREMERLAVSQSLQVIRRRVDEVGAVDLVLQAQGNDRIVLQVPGFNDPTRVRELIGKTAKLSFHLSQGRAQGPEKTSASSDIQVLSEYGADGVHHKIEREVLLTGDELLDARVGHDQNGRAVVHFQLTSKGGRLFGDVTRANLHKLLAVVLDGKVLSSAEIQDVIYSSGQISGRFSVKEANDLAMLMRSGALPAPLKILEQRVVGPGLGRDSIELGTYATIVSIIAVSVLMVLSYSFFGLFALVGLVFNLLFLLSSMGYLGATLTLPGIAGIALTVGMAVDANVLINERIKEEIALGRRLLSAIDTGHHKAMSSIIDSNVTTLIGAAILYVVGTGPVQGFAVTLALGVIISMFTAIELTKFFVTVWARLFRPKRLWI